MALHGDGEEEGERAALPFFRPVALREGPVSPRGHPGLAEMGLGTAGGWNQLPASIGFPGETWPKMSGISHFCLLPSGCSKRLFLPRKEGEDHSIKSFSLLGRDQPHSCCVPTFCYWKAEFPRLCQESIPILAAGGAPWWEDTLPLQPQGHKSCPARLRQCLRVETELILMDTPWSQGQGSDLCPEGREGAEHDSVGSTRLFRGANNGNCVIQCLGHRTRNEGIWLLG